MSFTCLFLDEDTSMDFGPIFQTEQVQDLALVCLSPSFVTVDYSSSRMQLQFEIRLLPSFHMPPSEYSRNDKVMPGGIWVAPTKLRRACTHTLMQTHVHTHVYTQMLLCVHITAVVTSFMWPRAVGHTWKGECVTNMADKWDLTGNTMVCEWI